LRFVFTDPISSSLADDLHAWTTQQKEVRDWLRREAPSLAGAYEGAVRLMALPSFQGRVHFVSHVVRVIFTQLPHILDPHFVRSNAGEFYKSTVNEVEKHWPRAVDNLPNVNAEPSDFVNITAAANYAVEELLHRHRAHKKQQTSAFSLAKALFRLLPDGDTAVPERLARHLERERRWFVKRAHLAQRMDKVPTEDGLDKVLLIDRQILPVRP
jgi:hypothetical protein